MTRPVYIVGHKNPDNDSIASAVAYAYLKNQLAAKEDEADRREYVPACLGVLPPESTWVLEQNHIDVPKLIESVAPCVSDAMSAPVATISEDATIADAMHTMHDTQASAVAVVNEQGTFVGLATMRMAGKCCVAATSGSEDSLSGTFSSVLVQSIAQMIDAESPQFAPNTTIDDAADTFVHAGSCMGAIVDANGICKGTISRGDTLDAPRKSVILVDHNEVRQAVDGLNEAEIMEVVDHHRIGDVSTASPIMFTNRPWGSCATIITTLFRCNEVEIPRGIAALLLSAILTDTVILKSPTATDIDHTQVAYLSDLIGVDAREFGLQVFRCRGGEKDMDIAELVGADSKEFSVGDGTVLIAQHETVDLDGALAREDEARAYMRSLVDQKGYDFVLLLMTDILAEGSQFIVEGNHKLVDRVFDIDSSKGVWMPGVLSRKKQVAAPILSA
ncbi:MAG: putative manganese-dependent inorganic diphosphatase [Eggerthellaceae bacterium]|jgi:manganese-dependent inorganic pyrophosphatase|nr:putative manganese-dependent inorganic diphosphatase [Eggerthellaceae bacterium]